MVQSSKAYASASRSRRLEPLLTVLVLVAVVEQFSVPAAFLVLNSRVALLQKR